MRTHEAYFLVCITMINQEERWIWWEIWGGARRLEEDHDSHLVYLPQVPPERRPCNNSNNVYVDESSSGSTTAAVVKRAQQRAARESRIRPSREARMMVFIGGSSTWIHLGTHHVLEVMGSWEWAAFSFLLFISLILVDSTMGTWESLHAFFISFL